MQSSILVTGGAGYIGSHIVRQLALAGEQVVVLDDLSTGFANAVLAGKLIVGDIGDSRLVKDIIQDYHVETVIHLAAATSVAESIANPTKYYANNTLKTSNLLQVCTASQVKQFIFSSTAAVYGIPEQPLVTEESITLPINPYGTSKLLCEWLVGEQPVHHPGFHYVILRYFNVAGAEPTGQIGQSTQNASNLIKAVVETITGKRPQVPIFGTDYPTADGTCIRDYIHVEDVASAHGKALQYLRQGGESITLNCGYGHGYSVREVLTVAERVANKAVNQQAQARRPGDPPAVIAEAKKIRHILQWQPHYDNLEFIIQTALAWEEKI